MKENKGITLIALVVTIVILIILASVTLSMVLSNNGILNMAKKAVSSTVIASEKEYMEQNILSVQLGKYTENVSSEKLGEPLYDKNLKNGDKWHIITANNHVYGTNWNYIEKGTEISNYGIAQNSWIVNYETGEVMQLEEEKYSSITVKDTISVRDDLIINIDSAMLDSNVQNTKESIEQALGAGVELHNFDFQNDGLMNNEFIFDGENDFITINQEDANFNDNEEWFENGFTFEFYGNIERGTHWAYSGDQRGTKIDNTFENYGGNYGVFQITEKNDDYSYVKTRVLAFGTTFNKTENKIFTKFFLAFKSQGNDLYDEFSNSSELNWWKDYKSSITDQNAHYYTVSIKKNEDNSFTQTYYEDGKLIKTGVLNKNCITQTSNLKKNLMTIGAIQEGYSSSNQPFNQQASVAKMEAKCLRIYNRGLTTEEVLQNYKKTTEYHTLMETAH